MNDNDMQINNAQGFLLPQDQNKFELKQQNEQIRREIIAKDYLSKNIYAFQAQKNSITVSNGNQTNSCADFIKTKKYSQDKWENDDAYGKNTKERPLIQKEMYQNKKSSYQNTYTQIENKQVKSLSKDNEQFEYNNNFDRYKTLMNFYQVNQKNQQNSNAKQISDYQTKILFDTKYKQDGFYRQTMPFINKQNDIEQNKTKKYILQNQKNKLTYYNNDENRITDDIYARKLEDLSKLGKELKLLQKDQKVSKQQMNKLKNQKLIKESNIRAQWGKSNDIEKDLHALVQKYPGLANNKNVQNQLEMIKRKAEQGESAEIEKEQLVKGFNLHMVNPTNLLQGDSENDVSENFEIDKNFVINNLSNDSDSSQQLKEIKNKGIEQQKVDEILIINQKRMKSSDPTQKKRKHTIKQFENEREIVTSQNQFYTTAGGFKMKEQQNGIKSMNNLQKVKIGLQACKGESGFFNPLKAFNCLNNIQKEEDPNLYEPAVVKQINAQKKRELELKNMILNEKQQKYEKARELDKALFDFDEEINNLEEVEERYPVQIQIQSDNQDKKSSPKKEKQQVQNFEIKQIERPNLPSNVLQDIEKMKVLFAQKNQQKSQNAQNYEKKPEELNFKPAPVFAQQTSNFKQLDDYNNQIINFQQSQLVKSTYSNSMQSQKNHLQIIQDQNKQENSQNDQNHDQNMKVNSSQNLFGQLQSVDEIIVTQISKFIQKDQEIKNSESIHSLKQIDQDQQIKNSKKQLNLQIVNNKLELPILNNQINKKQNQKEKEDSKNIEKESFDVKKLNNQMNSISFQKSLSQSQQSIINQTFPIQNKQLKNDEMQNIIIDNQSIQVTDDSQKIVDYEKKLRQSYSNKINGVNQSNFKKQELKEYFQQSKNQISKDSDQAGLQKPSSNSNIKISKKLMQAQNVSEEKKTLIENNGLLRNKNKNGRNKNHQTEVSENKKMEYSNNCSSSQNDQKFNLEIQNIKSQEFKILKLNPIQKTERSIAQEELKENKNLQNLNQNKKYQDSKISDKKLQQLQKMCAPYQQPIPANPFTKGKKKTQILKQNETDKTENSKNDGQKMTIKNYLNHSLIVSETKRNGENHSENSVCQHKNIVQFYSNQIALRNLVDNQLKNRNITQTHSALDNKSMESMNKQKQNHSSFEYLNKVIEKKLSNPFSKYCKKQSLSNNDQKLAYEDPQQINNVKLNMLKSKHTASSQSLNSRNSRNSMRINDKILVPIMKQLKYLNSNINETVQDQIQLNPNTLMQIKNTGAYVPTQIKQWQQQKIEQNEKNFLKAQKFYSTANAINNGNEIKNKLLNQYIQDDKQKNLNCDKYKDNYKNKMFLNRQQEESPEIIDTIQQPLNFSKNNKNQIYKNDNQNGQNIFESKKMSEIPILQQNIIKKEQNENLRILAIGKKFCDNQKIRQNNNQKMKIAPLSHEYQQLLKEKQIKKEQNSKSTPRSNREEINIQSQNVTTIRSSAIQKEGGAPYLYKKRFVNKFISKGSNYSSENRYNIVVKTLKSSTKNSDQVNNILNYQFKDDKVYQYLLESTTKQQINQIQLKQKNRKKQRRDIKQNKMQLNNNEKLNQFMSENIQKKHQASIQNKVDLDMTENKQNEREYKIHHSNNSFDGRTSAHLFNDENLRKHKKINSLINSQNIDRNQLNEYNQLINLDSKQNFQNKNKKKKRSSKDIQNQYFSQKKLSENMTESAQGVIASRPTSNICSQKSQNRKSKIIQIHQQFL